MLASPAYLSSALVTILALILYFYMCARVGQMRTRHGVKAPAMTGPVEFECALRVQLNTLEHLPIFVPILWLATIYFGYFPLAAPALGVVWIIGRALYMDGYMRAPEKRGPGFGLASVAEILLLILALVGVLMSWATVG
jgi:glutathione S-transferase